MKLALVLLTIGCLSAGFASCGPAPAPQPPGTDAETQAHVEEVLASTTQFWGEMFGERRIPYLEPEVGYVRHAGEDPGDGPARYVPALGGIFVDDLDLLAIKAELGANSRTLIALVIAHEVGHHVQEQFHTAGQEDLLPDTRLQPNCRRTVMQVSGSLAPPAIGKSPVPEPSATETCLHYGSPSFATKKLSCLVTSCSTAWTTARQRIGLTPSQEGSLASTLRGVLSRGT